MIVIKRYSNRKLYDTVARQYVTLEELGEMIRNGNDIQVFDHSSGVDMTTLVLAQIIFEQEKRIGGLLPQKILARLVQTGGSTLEELRQTLRTIIEPNQPVEDEIRRRLQLLVEEGFLSQAEGQRLAELLLDSSLRPAAMQSGVDENPTDQVSKDELEALLKQVEQLERQIEALQSNEK